MALDLSLYELLPDTITIEAYSSMTAQQAVTYSTGVTYRAQVVYAYEKVIDRNGREIKSNARAIIPGRVAVDPRSRVTLPTGWVPQQPPILAVRPVGGVTSMALDQTELLF